MKGNNNATKKQQKSYSNIPRHPLKQSKLNRISTMTLLLMASPYSGDPILENGVGAVKVEAKAKDYMPIPNVPIPMSNMMY